MSAFATTQIISASCSDLIKTFNTNQHIYKPIHIKDYIFHFEVILNHYKYIQLRLVVHKSPTDIEHIALFCRFHCQPLTLLNEPTLFHQITRLKNKNDRISWPLRQLHFANCENILKQKHLKNTQKLKFYCAIRILEIKPQKSVAYMPRWPFNTSSDIRFEWNITEDLLSSFRNAKCTRRYYSRNIYNIWKLCCHPNGNNNETNGCLLLSLELIRLPIEIASMQINLRFECGDKCWVQQDCIFNYDTPAQIWSSGLFKTSSLYTLETLTFNVSIQIKRISHIKGNEIPKDAWNQYGIDTQSEIDFDQDIEVKVEPIHGFKQKRFEQQMVLNEDREVNDEKMDVDILQLKFEEWLRCDLKLGEYLSIFQRNNKADISQIRDFTDVILRDIGVGDEYHRQLILESAHDIGRKQVEFEYILGKNNILGPYKAQLRMHGILTIYDIQREIKSKHDIERIFDIYGEGEKIDEIWRIVDQSSAKLHTVALHDECREMAQKMRMFHERICGLKCNIFSQTVPLRVQQNNAIKSFLDNVKKYQRLISTLEESRHNSSRNSFSSDASGILVLSRYVPLRQSSTTPSSSDNSSMLTVEASYTTYSHRGSESVMGPGIECYAQT